MYSIKSAYGLFYARSALQSNPLAPKGMAPTSVVPEVSPPDAADHPPSIPAAREGAPASRRQG